MSVWTIILIILVIALLGGFSGIGGGPFYGTGYYGGGGRAHYHNPVGLAANGKTLSWVTALAHHLI
jgi:Protein of unknown function (DUF3309)